MPDRQWEPAASPRRNLAWVVLLAAAVVAGGLLARVTGTGDGTLPVLPDSPDERAVASPQAGEASPPGAGTGHAQPAWRRLPHSPLVRRHGHSAVWTGEEVIFWGGARSDERVHRTGLDYLRSGASYDPRTGRWRRLPASPLPGRSGHVAVWSGHEMLVWDGTGRGAGPAGGAYDPVRRSWRALAPGPIDGARDPGGAWTGRALLVWGSVEGRWAAASYEPGGDAWERLPDPPPEVAAGAPQAVWAGRRLVLWTTAAGERSAVATWDPASSSWSVGGVAGTPAVAGLLPAGRRVLAWGGDGPAWALSYDVETAAARRFARPPLVPAELLSGWDGRRLVGWSGEHNAAFVVEPSSGALTLLPGAPLAPRAGAAGAWTGTELVVWGGASADGHHADGAALRPPPGPLPRSGRVVR